jgi:hypothetical protein
LQQAALAAVAGTAAGSARVRGADGALQVVDVRAQLVDIVAGNVELVPDDALARRDRADPRLERVDAVAEVEMSFSAPGRPGGRRT